MPNQEGKRNEECDAELDQLAEAWVALWQTELAALAADPEVVEAWRQVMGLGAAWARAAAGEPADGKPRPAGGTPRPAPARVASRPDAGDAERGGDPALRARINALERRLAALERGAAGDGADRRRPRRRPPPA